MLRGIPRRGLTRLLQLQSAHSGTHRRKRNPRNPKSVEQKKCRTRFQTCGSSTTQPRALFPERGGGRWRTHLTDLPWRALLTNWLRLRGRIHSSFASPCWSSGPAPSLLETMTLIPSGYAPCWSWLLRSQAGAGRCQKVKDAASPLFRRSAVTLRRWPRFPLPRIRLSK